MPSILGKPEPKEQEDSLEYTSKVTALWPYQSPNQGRTQRCRGRCSRLPITEERRLQRPDKPHPPSFQQRPWSSKHGSKKGSMSSWPPDPRQKPPRLDTHLHNAHLTLPMSPTRKVKLFLCALPPSCSLYSSIIFQTLGGRHLSHTTPAMLIWDAYLGH